MELSAVGRAVLVAREGRRLEAYRDSVGIWTIGVGHTGAAGPPAVTPGLRLTVSECDALFARDVARFAQSVRDAVPAELPDHAFDALVSLCFNIGPAAFQRSSVVRRLVAGDPAGAAEAILLWNRPAVLIPRRGAEYDQFRTPYAVTLPRARRGDAAPVDLPGNHLPGHDLAGQDLAGSGTVRGGPPRPAPSGRRPIPRVPVPPARQRPPVVASPAATGLLASLWARLRAGLRGSG